VVEAVGLMMLTEPAEVFEFWSQCPELDYSFVVSAKSQQQKGKT
jgi:hypothetical protein